MGWFLLWFVGNVLLLGCLKGNLWLFIEMVSINEEIKFFCFGFVFKDLVFSKMRGVWFLIE